MDEWLYYLIAIVAVLLLALLPFLLCRLIIWKSERKYAKYTDEGERLRVSIREKSEALRIAEFRAAIAELEVQAAYQVYEGYLKELEEDSPKAKRS